MLQLLNRHVAIAFLFRKSACNIYSSASEQIRDRIRHSVEVTAHGRLEYILEEEVGHNDQSQHDDNGDNIPDHDRSCEVLAALALLSDTGKDDREDKADEDSCYG